MIDGERRTGMDEAARVREWHFEEGWGVLDSEQTPGGCWVHFSHLHMQDNRELQAGQQVHLEWKSETGEDGYSFRATHRHLQPGQRHRLEWESEITQDGYTFRVGHTELQPGQLVRLEWESVTNQDGYTFRATHVSPRQ